MKVLRGFGCLVDSLSIDGGGGVEVEVEVEVVDGCLGECSGV